MNKNILYQFSFAFCLICIPFNLMAKEDKDFIIKLESVWKFSIGDNKEWANPDYDDSSWESIKVPSSWEDQGYAGYDGYAWYRTSFSFTKEMKSKDLFLNMGYIDDVDQVFLNGHLIGFSGTFPPQFATAMEARRKYPIPEEYLNQSGKNVICVRVYNNQMAGGILSGDIGISGVNFKSDISLAGLWNFKTGDNKLWKEAEYNDKQWKKIVVPSNWENHGYFDYNGFAWYRKHFTVPEEFNAQKFVLVIGKIYHIEEVYINGKLIGSSGKMPVGKHAQPETDDSKKCRTYTIPEKLLYFNKENVIAIRIYNIEYKGGIIEGPVGLFKLSNFNKYSRELTEIQN